MPAPVQVDTLVQSLGAGASTAAVLARQLGISQPGISRALAGLEERRLLFRFGNARATRYALRRPIAQIGDRWPVRRIDANGKPHLLGHLCALAADQYFFESNSKKRTKFAYATLTNGLPYYLQDQRPGGFIGRAVPRRFPELELPQRVMDWNDAHYLQYLTQRGSDVVGDLITGEASFDAWLQATHAPRAADWAVSARDRESRFPEMAEAVIGGQLPGSSAHGEHPKFTATLVDEPGANSPRQVIVKFSPIMNGPVGQRWGDLLRAEHLAHLVLAGAGIPACTSRIFDCGGRRFLEVDRFDRRGATGRKGVTSLLAIDSTFYGQLDNWVASAARLRADSRIDDPTLEDVRRLYAFGDLIANTDRHFGNLAFFDEYSGTFELAPAYDMLPMLFAPQNDHVVARQMQRPVPTSATHEVWDQMRDCAAEFWQRLADDALVSAEFRAIAAACFATLR